LIISALLQLGQQLCLLRLALLLDQLAARDDDVHPLLVDLDDPRRDLLADPVADVARAADVDLARGQEHGHADVDEQSALDLAQHGALDVIALLVRLDDVLPAADAVGLALAERDEALGVFDLLDQTLDLAARLHGRGVGEFVQRDASLGLVVDVDDDHAVVQDLDDLALDDLVGGQVVDGLADRGVEVRERLRAERFRREPRQLVGSQHELLHQLLAVHRDEIGLGKERVEVDDRLRGRARGRARHRSQTSRRTDHPSGGRRGPGRAITPCHRQKRK
jgi:hypothetical protein